MKKMLSTLISLVLASYCHLSVAESVEFRNVTIHLLEIKTDQGGGMLVLTFKDSDGLELTELCSTAMNKRGVAVPVSDSSYHSVLSIALAASATNTPVWGWGLDTPTEEPFCRLMNIAMYK